MGRIIAQITVRNALDAAKSMQMDALVDTGASYLTLPSAWKTRFGKFASEEEIQLETATQEIVKGLICGPVRIQIEGFRVISNDVLFLDMKPADGAYEPLIGYIILEQSGAAVDMLGRRLLPVKHMDLK